MCFSNGFFIYFTGALLFGSINNRVNNRAHQRLYDLPPPHGVRPLPLRKRRLRGKGQKFRKRRLRNRRPVVGGRRRLRKNMNVRRRPGAAVFQPNYNLDYINNHRIQVNLKWLKLRNAPIMVIDRNTPGVLKLFELYQKSLQFFSYAKKITTRKMILAK